MATAEKVPMLAEGHAYLTEELKRLKTIERPAVVEAIEEARAHGDLSENAEYHAAKERQGQIEATIADLEDRLSRGISPWLAKASPAITRAASLASGTPMTLLTKGMVREARGLTSSTYTTPC